MYFEFDCLKIYYEVEKSNNKNLPIIFLHGWGGNVNSFKLFNNKLKTKTTCVYMDFPPFGKSSNINKPLHIRDYALIVVKLLNKLKIKKVNIVAHSFGGRVALYMASFYKNKVHKMLLTGCAGIKRRELKIKLKVLVFKFKKFLSKMHLYSKNKLSQSGSDDYKKLSTTMQQTFKNIVNYDETPILKNITCETLFVWGELDKETPFYFTKIFKKNIKNSEVIVFSKLSHFAYLERPNTFLLILEKFFKI